MPKGNPTLVKSAEEQSRRPDKGDGAQYNHGNERAAILLSNTAKITKQPDGVHPAAHVAACTGAVDSAHSPQVGLYSAQGTKYSVDVGKIILSNRG